MSSKSKKSKRKAKGLSGPSLERVPLGDLDGFAATRLDWDSVREQFERLVSTSLGRRGLRELEPLEDKAAREAHARVAELVAGAATTGEPPLGDLADPCPRIEAARANRMALSETDLASLLDFLRAIVRTSVWFAERREAYPACAAQLAGLPELKPLRDSLERGLDGRGGIRDEASGRLAKLREQVRVLIQRVEKKAKAIANRPELKGALADGGGRVALRDGRPVLLVKAKQSGRLRGMIHDRSASGETVFVEPAELIEDGNALAAMRADEAREVQRLLTEWTREVLAQSERIERTADRLIAVELAVVGKRFCESFGGRVPELADTLVLRGARHPMLIAQERGGQIESCTPIDVRLGDPFCILVLTGPNTGGKTLALKTAGLAVLLTRLGLPFPCEPGSQVPLWRGIVADIGDDQEVAQNLSTFSAHLARIAGGLPRASNQTLFLLDELGGGTDPADGAALGAALLEWLRQRTVPTLASTHIGRLKEFAFRHANVENASVEFDVETLRPMYRLVVGTPGESRALVIARRLGFDPSILADAERRVSRPREESAALMEDIRGARVEAEKSRTEAGERALEAERRVDELQREAAHLEARRTNLERDAQAELEARLSEARIEAERATKLLEQVPAEHRKPLGETLAKLRTALRSASLTDRRQSFLDELRKGDLVYVPRFSKRCPVLRIDRDKGRVKVRLGRQELMLELDDVSISDS